MMITFDIVALITGGILGVYFLIEEIYLKDKINWKRFAPLLFIFVVYIYSSISAIKENDRKADYNKNEIISEQRNTISNFEKRLAEIIDSTRNSIYDSISKSKYDLAGTLQSGFDRNRPKEKEMLPFLYVTGLPGGNPYFSYSTDRKSINYSICIGNFGNDHATDLKDEMVFVTYNNDKPTFNSYMKRHIANKTATIPADTQQLVCFDSVIEGLTISENSSVDVPISSTLSKPSYIYFKLSFKNSKGQKMQPLQKIYYIRGDGTGEISDGEFKKIQRDLTANGLY